MSAAQLAKSAAETMAENARERTFSNLRAAIRVARDAVDAAERAINHNANNPSHAITGVLHALSWGNANAMSSVQTAIAINGDEHLMRMQAANEAIKP